MTNQGPLYAGTAANGAGGIWASPANAQGSTNFAGPISGAFASANNTDAGYLSLTNFGFTIPAGVTINGITVEFSGTDDRGTALISHAFLIIGGANTGTDQAASQSFSGTVIIGGISSLWGTTPTAAQVNASNFGVGISVHGHHTGNNVYCGGARITVAYTAVSGAKCRRTSNRSRIGSRGAA